MLKHWRQSPVASWMKRKNRDIFKSDLGWALMGVESAYNIVKKEKAFRVAFWALKALGA